MSYNDLTDEQQEEIIEADIRRALDNPMPPELKGTIKDLIEPHTINARIKHVDVMDCIDVAFPVIRDWLREHPEELTQ